MYLMGMEVTRGCYNLNAKSNVETRVVLSREVNCAVL